MGIFNALTCLMVAYGKQQQHQISYTARVYHAILALRQQQQSICSYMNLKFTRPAAWAQAQVRGACALTCQPVSSLDPNFKSM
jgi:hypothetical protein